MVVLFLSPSTGGNIHGIILDNNRDNGGLIIFRENDGDQVHHRILCHWFNITPNWILRERPRQGWSIFHKMFHPRHLISITRRAIMLKVREGDSPQLMGWLNILNRKNKVSGQTWRNKVHYRTKWVIWWIQLDQ